MTAPLRYTAALEVALRLAGEGALTTHGLMQALTWPVSKSAAQRIIARLASEGLIVVVGLQRHCAAAAGRPVRVWGVPR